MSEKTELHESPLHARHVALGASFTPFGAWTMPLKYNNELDEHRAVRSAAGLFDLSHMGEIRVSGPDAGKFLDYVLISTMSTLMVGKAKYSMIVDVDGGIIDDLIAYRLTDDEYLVVPNAGNTDVVWDALTQRHGEYLIELSNESHNTALIAVQGPNAEAIVVELVAEKDAELVREMKHYTAAQVVVAGIDTLLARTGYTGEDGFEVIIPHTQAEALWDKLTDAGQPHGLLPAGLAARDSLRLEAGMPLYGNELTRDITPVEAGMGIAFRKKTADFVGRLALDGREARTHIVALQGQERRAARADAEVFLGEENLGFITSGQPSPTLGYPIALARLGREVESGTELEVDIRGKRHPFIVVKTPFYRRPER